jgi:hypothetical protein
VIARELGAANQTAKSGSRRRALHRRG